MHPLAYLSFSVIAMANLTFFDQVKNFFFSRIAYHRGKVLNDDAEEFRSSWKKHYRPSLPIQVPQEPEIIDDLEGQIEGVTTASQIPKIKNIDEGTSKEMLLFLRSCRDPKVIMGSFYSFSRTTAITFTEYIIEYTMGLLISF
jgi:hypothetical protein